ncbi:MAG: hypothetical protein R2939_19685 [Kofleriaceae bacterium]
MRSPALALVVAALAARPAGAETVWEQAAPEVDLAVRQTYALAMQQGDAAVAAAADEMTALSTSSRVAQVGAALAAYRRARIAWPDGAEAAYRLGTTAFTFFVACPGPFAETLPCRRQRAEHAQLTLDAWHDFTRLAPKDPRATALLFERALLHTRMLLIGTDDPEAHLRAAAADYQTRLDRGDGINGLRDPSLGNLAETYMMLGDLDRAIPLYRAAVAAGGGPSVAYGLAVALDRDEQGAQAREIAQAQGPSQLERFRIAVEQLQDPFFVPEGEKHYYYALVEEALGLDALALASYDRFLASGAYPRYAARARANRAAVAERLAQRALARPGRR